MLSRMLGAARLSADTFEDVERDGSATIQALVVVIVVALASGIGSLPSGESSIVGALAFGVIRGVVSWVVWAAIAMFVGTQILKTEQTEADWGQLARGTGFAQTPGVLSIFAFIPFFIGFAILLLALAWQWASMVVAVRQCLDYTSTVRAFFVILISLIPVVIINGLVFWALRV